MSDPWLEQSFQEAGEWGRAEDPATGRRRGLKSAFAAVRNWRRDKQAAKALRAAAA